MEEKPKVLRRADQARAMQCSRWTVGRIEATDPTYPRSRQFSSGLVGVLTEEFDAWLRSRPVVALEQRSRKRKAA